jgi:2-C-methyl-D-erythritol 4-phosphate cytidylyltransferase
LVELAGRPLAWWSLAAFAAAEDVAQAVIAAPAGREAKLGSLAPDGLSADTITGGETRAESVGRALELVETELVAVHDAARPLVTPALIEALITRLVSAPGAAGVIAATPLTDTVKRVGEDRVIERTEDREGLWAAQTPQVFRSVALREGHAADPTRVAGATDDSLLVEQAGGRVMIEPSPEPNLKVTTREDLRLAEIILLERR